MTSFPYIFRKNLCHCWFTWTYRNNIFTSFEAKKGHIINLAVYLFDDMRYYNVVSFIFGQDASASIYSKPETNSLLKSRWKLSPEGWVKLT